VSVPASRLSDWLRLSSAGEVAAALSGASVTEHFAAQRSRGGDAELLHRPPRHPVDQPAPGRRRALGTMGAL